MSPPDPHGFAVSLTTLTRDFVRYARWRGAAALALMIGGALLEGVGLAMLIPLLALLAGQGDGTMRAATGQAFASLGVTDQFGQLSVLLAIFVALVFARAAVLGRRDAVSAALQLGFVESRRARLLEALGAASWGDIAGLRHARVLHALDDNVERTAAATQILLQIAMAAAMLAAQWLLVALIAPAMAAFAFALMLLAGLLLAPVMRRASRIGRSLATGRLRLFDGAAQLLGGLKVAMAQNLQHAFIAEFEETARELTVQRLDFMRRHSRSRIAGTTAGALAGAAVVLGGVWLGTPVVALIAALAVFTRMIGPVTTIGQSAQYLTGYLPGFVALRRLIAELAAFRGEPAETPVPPGAAVRFENVAYAHAPGVEGGVDDVSTTISPGEVVGVVGASGAGKTTFVDLLAGLLTPQVGSVAVGGVPLANGAACGWRDRVAYVGQDSYLFNDSIRRNLSLGLSDASDAAMWDALAAVGANALVAAMPAGLDTVVAERGARLSGGQRQRVALARALLRRPDLLILDEATNAVDVAGEADIFAALTALDPRPAIVVVAHRGETLRWCDRLLRFDGGRLVEDAPRQG